jgi:hypothetical protein
MNNFLVKTERDSITIKWPAVALFVVLFIVMICGGLFA